MILTVQARWVNTRTTKLSKWDIQNVLSVCNFGLFSQITNSYSRWPFLISGDGTPHSTPSTAAAWKPTVCHFNHTAPHGGQFFTNAKTTVGCADPHYMTQRSSAELIISTACCALAHLTIYYTAVTDRWHSLWQTQEELRWSGQQRLCPCPVYVVDSWGHPIDSPDRAAALEVLKAQKLSPTPPGQMSVLQDSHSDTHMQTNTHAMIPRDRQGTSRVYWCVSPARANIRFWHQNQHCWRASTPALFELIEAHSTSLESYSWDKDNNGFLVFECL